MSQIFLCMTSQIHWTWPLSCAIPFEPYSLWPGFTRSSHLFLIPFSTYGVRWGASVKSLNVDFTLNDVCFPIPPPQICILPKNWFLIMGWLLPTLIYTDKNFSNPRQSIRGQSIWPPLYLSNDLYHVGCRHKCSQHRLTQQGYLPIQVPERWVSPKSTQGGPSLYSWFGTTSFLHHIIFINHCGLLDMRASRTIMIPY